MILIGSLVTGGGVVGQVILYLYLYLEPKDRFVYWLWVQWSYIGCLFEEICKLMTASLATQNAPNWPTAPAGGGNYCCKKLDGRVIILPVFAHRVQSVRVQVQSFSYYAANFIWLATTLYDNNNFYTHNKIWGVFVQSQFYSFLWEALNRFLIDRVYWKGPIQQ